MCTLRDSTALTALGLRRRCGRAGALWLRLLGTGSCGTTSAASLSSPDASLACRAARNGHESVADAEHTQGGCAAEAPDNHGARWTMSVPLKRTETYHNSKGARTSESLASLSGSGAASPRARASSASCSAACCLAARSAFLHSDSSRLHASAPRSLYVQGWAAKWRAYWRLRQRW